MHFHRHPREENEQRRTLLKPATDFGINSGRPPTFEGIEGVRAWLAWTVVVHHIAELCGYGYDDVSHGGRLLFEAGQQAVSLFIIISGFVITHMRLGKPESYPLYIARRALRIYPAYLICLGLAIPTPLMVLAIANTTPWFDAITASFARIEVSQFSPLQFFVHLGLHLTLLQGIPPNGLLPLSQVQFLPPAWSLSLEWQFYLVAPFWIAAQRRWATGSVLAFVVVSGWVLFERGYFGDFVLPSLITGAGPYFCIGILTRLALGQGADRAYGVRRALVLLVISVIVIVAVGRICTIHYLNILVSIGLWSVVVHQVVGRRSDRTFPWLRLVNGRLATEAGKRSYAVYVLHWPVIVFIGYFARIAMNLGQVPMVALVGALGIPMTALGAELLFTFVEQPAIRFGRRLGRSARRS